MCVVVDSVSVGCGEREENEADELAVHGWFGLFWVCVRNGRFVFYGKNGADVGVVRFVVNLPATVFMFMNLNPFMSVLFGFPTTVVSTVSHLYYKAKSMMLTQERS